MKFEEKNSSALSQDCMSQSRVKLSYDSNIGSGTLSHKWIIYSIITEVQYPGYIDYQFRIIWAYPYSDQKVIHGCVAKQKNRFIEDILPLVCGRAI